MISLDEYFRGRDKTHAAELTDEMRNNAEILLAVVNDILFYEYGKPLKVSSGWRPADINRKVGGAKNSSHLTCEAIDLHDHDLAFADFIVKNQGILDRYDVYVENPRMTQGWVHIQTRPTRSGMRLFNP